MVHADPDEFDRLIKTGTARPMEIRGRTMKGWLRVDTYDVRTKRQLSR